MTAAAVSNHMLSLLQGMAFPATMTGVPPLTANVVPPNPDVTGTTQPTCWIWVGTLDEARSPSRYSAGTVPRAQVTGGPSGTKATEYAAEVYMLYAMASNDPDSNTLFLGMMDAIRATLRVSADPVEVTDPWTSAQSWVVDVGENMRGQNAVRALADQAMNEFSGLLTCTVTEIFSA